MKHLKIFLLLCIPLIGNAQFSFNAVIGGTNASYNTKIVDGESTINQATSSITSYANSLRWNNILNTPVPTFELEHKDIQMGGIRVRLGVNAELNIKDFAYIQGGIYTTKYSRTKVPLGLSTDVSGGIGSKVIFFWYYTDNKFVESLVNAFYLQGGYSYDSNLNPWWDLDNDSNSGQYFVGPEFRFKITERINFSAVYNISKISYGQVEFKYRINE